MSSDTSKPGVIDANRELLGQATPVVYKETSEAELRLHIFQPQDKSPCEGGRPAALFFFGSFWDQGVASQFAPHCAYLASRGMIAAAVEYRVAGLHGTTPVESVADARSAFRWVRSNAERLGIHPEKIVGGGASAGAHLVFCASMIEGGDEPGEDLSLSGAPNAQIAFSPIVDTSKRGAGLDRFADAKLAKAYSPIALVRKELPPSIIFHAGNDRLVPIGGVEKFSKKMRRKKNTCEFFPFDGQEHSFFNFNVNMANYEATLNSVDSFLVEQGFLEPGAEEESILG